MVTFDYAQFTQMKDDVVDQMIRREATETLIDSLEDQRIDCEDELAAAEKARAVFQEVAKITQANLKVRISNLVTTALLSVNKSWPEFEMVIQTRRNQPEIDLFFIEGGKLQEIPEASGVVDVASMALRISVWSLNKNRPTFVLDEPFKHLSKDNSMEASKMLKMLCDKLGIQIIMVSHDTEITNYADRVFQVTKLKKISRVKER